MISTILILLHYKNWRDTLNVHARVTRPCMLGVGIMTSEKYFV